MFSCDSQLSAEARRTLSESQSAVPSTGTRLSGAPARVSGAGAILETARHQGSTPVHCVGSTGAPSFGMRSGTPARAPSVATVSAGSLQGWIARLNVPQSVSYTHLTLPTSDLV